LLYNGRGNLPRLSRQAPSPDSDLEPARVSRHRIEKE
jgi:hypothetical protein